ncbi:C2H2-type domain-containing protein [Entamoeba marina]
MTDKLSYLDGLFNNHNDNEMEDDDCYQWDTNMSLNKQIHGFKKDVIQAKPQPRTEQIPVQEQFNMDILLNSYTSLKKVESKDTVHALEQKEKQVKGNINRWNKRTTEIDENERHKMELEFEASTKRKLKSEQKQKERQSKRPSYLHYCDIGKVISLINDFGEIINDDPWFVCVVCRRQFISFMDLNKHIDTSIFHALNTRLLNKEGVVLNGEHKQLDKGAYPTDIPDLHNNIGTEILKNIGWKDGEIVGKTKSTIEVNVVTNTSRAGIGASGSAVKLGKHH